VVDDHVRIAEAIEAGDRAALIAVSGEHRAETQAWLGGLLSRRSPGS